MAELQSNHDIMDAIAEDDFQMRMMKVAHYVCIFNAAIFSLAVLFDLQ